jgi:pyrroloquinoline-quinone synthase
MDFWCSLDQIARTHDVLRHPFYERWSAGELTGAELANYAGQYRHAVIALADASASAAQGADDGVRAQLTAHAAEEATHIALWDDFIDTVGGEHDADPTAQTAHCATVWAGGEERELLPTLVALYAIEAAQPAISRAKRVGLAEHYGVEGSGAAYFELHERLDVEHAAATRALIDDRLPGADIVPLLREAERVLAANWELLDGVDRVAPQDECQAGISKRSRLET